jgi:ParB family chromosome partitioning protein
VAARVKDLKSRGLESPYLKYFVIARINPLRFSRSAQPPELEATLEKMLASARKLDPSRVKREDLSRMGGPPAEPIEAE